MYGSMNMGCKLPIMSKCSCFVKAGFTVTKSNHKYKNTEPNLGMSTSFDIRSLAEMQTYIISRVLLLFSQFFGTENVF